MKKLIEKWRPTHWNEQLSFFVQYFYKYCTYVNKGIVTEDYHTGLVYIILYIGEKNLKTIHNLSKLRGCGNKHW
jgi:hypothetical protein